jgi:hypothetical protein
LSRKLGPKQRRFESFPRGNVHVYVYVYVASQLQQQQPDQSLKKEKKRSRLSGRVWCPHFLRNNNSVRLPIFLHEERLRNVLWKTSRNTICQLSSPNILIGFQLYG